MLPFLLLFLAFMPTLTVAAPTVHTGNDSLDIVERAQLDALGIERRRAKSLSKSKQVATTTTTMPCVNGSTYTMTATTSPTGIHRFIMNCGYDYTGGDMKLIGAASIQDCINQCGSTPGCVDLSFLPNGYCYLKNVTKPMTTASGCNAARLYIPTSTISSTLSTSKSSSTSTMTTTSTTSSSKTSSSTLSSTTSSTLATTIVSSRSSVVSGTSTSSSASTSTSTSSSSSLRTLPSSSSSTSSSVSSSTPTSTSTSTSSSTSSSAFSGTSSGSSTTSLSSSSSSSSSSTLSSTPTGTSSSSISSTSSSSSTISLSSSPSSTSSSSSSSTSASISSSSSSSTFSTTLSSSSTTGLSSSSSSTSSSTPISTLSSSSFGTSTNTSSSSSPSTFSSSFSSISTNSITTTSDTSITSTLQRVPTPTTSSSSSNSSSVSSISSSLSSTISSTLSVSSSSSTPTSSSSSLSSLSSSSSTSSSGTIFTTSSVSGISTNSTTASSVSSTTATTTPSTTSSTIPPYTAGILPAPTAWKALQGYAWNVTSKGTLGFNGNMASMNLQGDKCRTGSVGGKTIWNCGDMECGSSWTVCGFSMGPGFYGTSSVNVVDTGGITNIGNNIFMPAWKGDPPPSGNQTGWGMDMSNVVPINSTNGVVFAWEIWRGASDGSYVDRGNAVASVTLGSVFPIATRQGPLLTDGSAIQLGLLATMADGGYVYLYSMPQASGIITVTRVPASDAVFDITQYQTLNSNGVWVQGVPTPSQAIANYGMATAQPGGFGCATYGSVFYNAYLKKYLLFCNIYEYYTNMYASDTPYGPWSAEYGLLSGVQGYGSMAHPEYSPDGGKTIPWTQGPNGPFDIFSISFY